VIEMKICPLLAEPRLIIRGTIFSPQITLKVERKECLKEECMFYKDEDCRLVMK